MMQKKGNQRQKVIFALACSLLLVLNNVLPALAVSEGSTYEAYRTGAGEKSNAAGKESEYTVIEVVTEGDLRRLAEDCILDTWSRDKYIKLMNDIVLEEDTELCIPSFGGVFEGNGHEISNLGITGNGSAKGLFRYIQERGAVRNLTVSGKVSPDGSKNQVGGIAGVNYGCIYGCSFSGYVSGDCEVGGIAGVNGETGEIRNCRSGASVSGNHSTGGIAGSNQGTLNHCSNSGNINIHSTEVSYELEDITVERLEERNSTANVSAYTDTGGIAGISQGKIYYCTNEGDVGYPHVGYNVGGIVGRLHQGYVQNCTNTGHILGRKDVGGIAGQMEPFLEIQYLNDKLQDLDRETDKFLDLLDDAQKDLSGYGKQASTLAKELTDNLEDSRAAGGRLLQSAADIWYLYNQELTGVSDDLKTLNQDLEKQGTSDRDNGNVHDFTVSGGDLTVSGGDLTIKVPNDTAAYEAALKKFGDSSAERLKRIAEGSWDQAEDIQDDLDLLNSGMEAAGDRLGLLADTLEEGTDHTSSNMDALMEQARALRRLISDIRDDLFRYEGITVEDASDEAAGEGSIEPEALYDTSSFQQGKITLCSNEGLIEADTNVGGIVGQIATEYDMDPEDDITLTGTESFHIERTVKAVVRDSRNVGTITGKKDYAGGIVGKADFGAVISCESYGDVESTGGSYVGGVAGCSSYAVRSCYSMGKVSGKNYVGGIAGKGCDIFYSAAYPVLDVTGECKGSIAGQVESEGTLHGNYYVIGSAGGVDDIGYQGGATPLAYEEFARIENLPEEFSRFTVTFRAEGKELASYQCRYGDAIDRDQIPEIPEKEGYYGVWPEFDFSRITGNQVLEVQYEKWISSLESDQKDAAGRSIVLVEGNFLPGHQLVTEEAMTEGGAQTYTFAIRQKTADSGGTEAKDSSADMAFAQEPLTVRVLCENPDKTSVQVLGEDGVFRKTDAQVMGSYLMFSMERPGTFCLTKTADYGTLKIGIVSVCAVVLLVILVFIVKGAKKRRGKRTEQEAQGQEKSRQAEVILDDGGSHSDL